MAILWQNIFGKMWCYWCIEVDNIWVWWKCIRVSCAAAACVQRTQKWAAAGKMPSNPADSQLFPIRWSLSWRCHGHDTNHNRRKRWLGPESHLADTPRTTYEPATSDLDFISWHLHSIFARFAHYSYKTTRLTHATQLFSPLKVNINSNIPKWLCASR